MEKNQILQSDLWPEDKSLFIDMSDNYTGEPEKVFFDTLCYKMLNENAPCKELLLSPTDNEDSIYIFRIGDEEMEVGSTVTHACFHAMTLSGVLNANLKQIGCLNNDITLWQWLRNRNYSGIRYDQNFENQN